MYDHLTIYDGKTANSSKIGKYCGKEIPYNIISSSNSLYMVMETDKHQPSKGFQASYNTSVYSSFFKPNSILN